MIKGSKEELDQIARDYVCHEHKTMVVVTWHAQENSYVLRCQHNEYPEEVTREPSLTEAYKQGEELPEPLASNVKKSMEKRAARLPHAPQAETFTGVPATDLGTGELLRMEVIKALVDYARKYELDPARGHVCLMYGKPYITIDGYLYHAHETNIQYRMSSHPLTEQERKDYQVPVGAHAWLTNITKLPSGSEFSSLGIVTAEEMTEKSKKSPDRLAAPVIAKHPWLMAQKRGEWQALRRAFPIGESEPEKEG